MADIDLTWDNTSGTADWSFAVGDLATGSDIETAVLVSLFTDRTASADFQPSDGTTDRRGWWGDMFAPARPVGSRLWQLERAKKVGNASILQQARGYCNEALAWLVEDGIAASVDVKTQWLSATAL